MFIINQDEIINKLTTREDIMMSELYNYGLYKNNKVKNHYKCPLCKDTHGDNIGLYEPNEKNKKYTITCFGDYSHFKGTDVIGLVQKMENMNFNQAIIHLANKYGLHITEGKGQSKTVKDKNKAIEFYENKTTEALEKDDLDEALRNSFKADKEKENNYFFNFPHVDTSNKPLKIWENVEALLNELDIKPVFNIITKDIEIIFPDEVKLDIDSQIVDIYSICQKYGLKVSLDHVYTFVNRIASKNMFNPVSKYLEKCDFVWDTIPGRIEELCETLILKEGFSKELRNTLIKKWLMNVAHICDNEGDKNTEGVLVLQGPQGIGKTTFLKKIIPNEFLKTGLSLNPNDRDSIDKCLKYWVVELGELEDTLKAELGKLKAFITETTDEYRKPYARNSLKYPRTTAFYGSVNKSNFLKDETGDRRYWVIPIIDIDTNKLNSIDMEQLWGEVMFELNQNKDNLNLNKEELMELNESNEEFRIKNKTQIIVETSFYWEYGKDLWKFEPTSDIANKLNLNSTSGLKDALESMGAIIKRDRIKVGDSIKQVRGYIVPPYKDILKNDFPLKVVK